MANNNRIDPINEKFYRPLDRAELFTDVFFWIVTIVAALLIAVDRGENAKLYNQLQISLVIGTASSFFIGAGIRFYWAPRAQKWRLKDFLTKALSVPLTPHLTEGYYNNKYPPGYSRLGAMLLENSLFSKEISRRMCQHQRLFSLVGLIVFILTMIQEDLGYASFAAGIFFGEQIIMRWFRLECFRMSSEHTYESGYTLLNSSARDQSFEANILDLLFFYERAKSISGIKLSENIFKKINPDLSKEWESTKALLQIP